MNPFCRQPVCNINIRYIYILKKYEKKIKFICDHYSRISKIEPAELQGEVHLKILEAVRKGSLKVSGRFMDRLIKNAVLNYIDRKYS